MDFLSVFIPMVGLAFLYGISPEMAVYLLALILVLLLINRRQNIQQMISMF